MFPPSVSTRVVEGIYNVVLANGDTYENVDVYPLPNGILCVWGDEIGEGPDYEWCWESEWHGHIPVGVIEDGGGVFQALVDKRRLG